MQNYRASEKLSSIRQQTDDDERRLESYKNKLLQPESHARAQAEAMKEEERVNKSKAELEILESEAKVADVEPKMKEFDWHDEADSLILGRNAPIVEERRNLLESWAI